MNKIEDLIANGTITVKDLVEATELIERAKLVSAGIEACKKTITIPLGSDSVSCYNYMDRFGEYESWAKCEKDGRVTFYSNWGGNHEIGSCNITSFEEVYKAFSNTELASDLKRFLKQKIEESEKK